MDDVSVDYCGSFRLRVRFPCDSDANGLEPWTTESVVPRLIELKECPSLRPGELPRLIAERTAASTDEFEDSTSSVLRMKPSRPD